MNRYLDLARTVVISWEFAVFLLWSILYFTQLDLPEWVLSRAILNDEKIKWLSLLPAGVMALIFKESANLIFPDKDKNELITGFPEFWILRNMLFTAKFYAVVFAIVGFYGWMLDSKDNKSLLIYTLGAALIGSGVVYLSFHNAISTVNVIFSSKGKIS